MNQPEHKALVYQMLVQQVRLSLLYHIASPNFTLIFNIEYLGLSLNFMGSQRKEEKNMIEVFQITGR